MDSYVLPSLADLFFSPLPDPLTPSGRSTFPSSPLIYLRQLTDRSTGKVTYEKLADRITRRRVRFLRLPVKYLVERRRRARSPSQPPPSSNLQTDRDDDSRRSDWNCSQYHHTMTLVTGRNITDRLQSWNRLLCHYASTSYSVTDRRTHWPSDRPLETC